jgi:hypothetical protein
MDLLLLARHCFLQIRFEAGAFELCVIVITEPVSSTSAKPAIKVSTMASCARCRPDMPVGAEKWGAMGARSIAVGAWCVSAELQINWIQASVIQHTVAPPGELDERRRIAARALASPWRLSLSAHSPWIH